MGYKIQCQYKDMSLFNTVKIFFSNIVKYFFSYYTYILKRINELNIIINTSYATD